VSTLCCRASFRAKAPSGAMSLEVMETQSETLSSNAAMTGAGRSGP
jgi:hypothetical protein